LSPLGSIPPLHVARVRALGGAPVVVAGARWSGAPHRQLHYTGASRGGGGAQLFLGPGGRHCATPIKHSAFAVFLGAEFYLAVLPAEATFRLSAGGFKTRLTLLMPALTLLMPGLGLSAYL